MSQKDIGNKIPIYKLKAGKEVEDYYDEWTVENKYDKDMVDWNYTGPKETSEVFIKYEKNKNAKIYDAGCGTGLVGVELKKYGFSNFFGADLSQKLLDLVPKDLYQKLDKVDLNKPIQEVIFNLKSTKELDEIYESGEAYLPDAESVSKIDIPLFKKSKIKANKTGTIVRWCNPNKIRPKTAKVLSEHIEMLAGRIFRYFLNGYDDGINGVRKCKINVLVYDYNGSNYEINLN